MRTTTKKSIAAFALVCMLVLALATAVVCGGGSLLAARADETTPPAEETPAVAVIVKTVREDMDDASKVKAHVLFAEDNGTTVSYINASTAPVENLEQYEAYKNKITVNGKPKIGRAHV